MQRKPVAPESVVRCVARTFSIEEAKQIADRFEAQGYDTNIVENRRGSMAIYEVWASRKGEVLEVPKL